MAKSKTEAPLNGGERHPDADAREAIRSDLHTTMLVEAAAGTGKTTSLVDRMVALVATGAARVESLSAVTFTIRAAAQLSQRFQNALETRRAEETDPGRRRRPSVPRPRDARLSVDHRPYVVRPAGR